MSKRQLLLYEFFQRLAAVGEIYPEMCACQLPAENQACTRNAIPGQDLLCVNSKASERMSRSDYTARGHIFRSSILNMPAEMVFLMDEIQNEWREGCGSFTAPAKDRYEIDFVAQTPGTEPQNDTYLRVIKSRTYRVRKMRTR